MTRLALAIVVTAAAGVGILTHEHKRPAPVQSDVRVSATPDLPRASRAWERQPLPRHLAPKPRASRQRPRLTGGLADVTEYCATGNRNADGRWPELGDVAVLDRSIPFGTRVVIEGRSYVVRDWIGHGSDFDIYGGSDAGCEQRALNFGRRHERVEVAS